MIQEIAPFTLKAKVYQFSQFGKKWIFFHKMDIYPLIETECWMSSLLPRIGTDAVAQSFIFLLETKGKKCIEIVSRKEKASMANGK